MVSRFKLLPASLLAAGLVGCASVPADWGRADVGKMTAERGRAVPQVADAKSFTTQALSTPLTADTAVQLALINNPDLRRETARLGFAAAEVYNAGRLANPVFSLTRMSGDSSAGANVPQLTLGLAFNFANLLFLPANSRIAGAQFEAAKLEVASVAMDLAAEVESAWYAAVAPLYASMVARFHLCLASLITSTWCTVWRKLRLGSLLALALIDSSLVVLINKVDNATQEQVMEKTAYWQSKLNPIKIFAISALHGYNLEGLLPLVLDYIPEHPAYYDKEDLTDRNLRFFASEIIREKIFNNYQKEIPYSTEVIITAFKEEDNISHISAEIIVERESQKNIIIGKGGAGIKKIGMEARKDIEKFIDGKVFLETHVKVIANWRSKDNYLRSFGYER